MKSITKQAVGKAFRAVSGVFPYNSAGMPLCDRGACCARARHGVLFGRLFLLGIVFLGLSAQANAAWARQKAGDAGQISVMDDARVAGAGDIADISFLGEDETSSGDGVAMAASDISPSAGEDAPGSDGVSSPVAGKSEMPPAPSAVSAPVVPSPSGADATQGGVKTGAVIDVPSSVPAPSAPLSPPKKAAAPMDVAGGDQGQAQTKLVTKPEVSPGDDSYYDSLPLPPSTALERKTAGPREVDPKLEPASKFVVVTKDADANGFEALLVSANRALSLGRYDAAIDLFDQLCRKNGRDRRALLGRAVAFQKAGRDEAARAAYDEFLKLDPDNREAQINRLGLVAKDYPAVALRQMLDLRKKWSDDAGLAAQIGLAQARLGNDQDALEYLGIAASLDSSNASHIFNMAVVSDRLGNKDQAVKLYEQALQIDSVHGGGRSIPREVVYDRLSVLRNQ